MTCCPLGKDPHCDFDYHPIFNNTLQHIVKMNKCTIKIECLSLVKHIAPLSQNEQVYNPVRNHNYSGLRSSVAISNGSDWLELLSITFNGHNRMRPDGYS